MGTSVYTSIVSTIEMASRIVESLGWKIIHINISGTYYIMAERPGMRSICIKTCDRGMLGPIASYTRSSAIMSILTHSTYEIWAFENDALVRRLVFIPSVNENRICSVQETVRVFVPIPGMRQEILRHETEECTSIFGYPC